MGLLGDPNPLQQLQGLALHLSFRALAHLHRRQGEVVEHREVGKQIELLEHHANLPADRIYAAQIVADFNAIHHD